MPASSSLPPEYDPSGPAAPSGLEQLNLIDLLNILLKRRRLIIYGIFGVTLLTGIVFKLTPPTFTAVAQFLPSKDPDLSSRMGTLIGSPNVKLESVEENYTSEYYNELLNSPAFLERLATRQFNSARQGKGIDLYEYYGIDADTVRQRTADLYKAFSKDLKITLNRLTKIVTVNYSCHDPELAAGVLNGMLEEVTAYNQVIKGDRTKQKRQFIEKQVLGSQLALKEAETTLADFVARNRKIVTPDIELELDRLKRAVRVQEDVYISLNRQLELTKIEEQEQRSVLDIIQPAIAPYYKSAPKVRILVAVALVLSTFLFCGLAFALELWGKLQQIDQNEPRNRELMRYLGETQNDLRRLLRLKPPAKRS